ncbi:MAG: GGDEF domain-containing protein [Dokdonella sp.]
MSETAALTWVGFVVTVLCTGYLALRSGWSERFNDPALTMWQLFMGVIAVAGGYLICGPMRTSALLPLMIIFIFGAFSLRRRQIVGLTLFTVCALIGVMAIRHFHPELAGPGEITMPAPLLYDINNLVMVLVVLPALGVLAVRLSGMRRALRQRTTALASALGDVTRLATYDELTGVPNRRSIIEALDDAAAIANNGGIGFCVGLVDLDDFKKINDKYGHAHGDTVLHEFAQTATRSLRTGDVFGRWGGEEFLFVLPGLAADGAAQIITRLQAAVRDTPIAGCRVTFSAGISAYRAGEDTDATVARSDAAMYAGKHGGRDAVRLERD